MNKTDEHVHRPSPVCMAMSVMDRPVQPVRPPSFQPNDGQALDLDAAEAMLMASMDEQVCLVQVRGAIEKLMDPGLEGWFSVVIQDVDGHALSLSDNELSLNNTVVLLGFKNQELANRYVQDNCAGKFDSASVYEFNYEELKALMHTLSAQISYQEFPLSATVIIRTLDCPQGEELHTPDLGYVFL